SWRWPGGWRAGWSTRAGPARPTRRRGFGWSSQVSSHDREVVGALVPEAGVGRGVGDVGGAAGGHLLAECRDDLAAEDLELVEHGGQGRSEERRVGKEWRYLV